VLDGPAYRVLVFQLERTEEHLPQVTHNLTNRAKNLVLRTRIRWIRN
jgi:hypothetical protein